MYLKRSKCAHAIKRWEKTRTKYSKVKKIIQPTAVFYFQQQDCQWIKTHNKSATFHAYAGVRKDKFILIIVPLDKNGKEVNLHEYLAVELTNLSNEITLIETDVVTTISKIKLSKNLEVTKNWQEVDLPTYNKPDLLERDAFKDIMKWKNECFNWFYFECKFSNAQNVFRAFTVPSGDLDYQTSLQGDILAFFGFRFSTISMSEIPTLIFIKSAKSNYENIGADEISGGDDDQLLLASKENENPTGSVVNTKDWSQPCPPLCADKDDFTLFTE